MKENVGEMVIMRLGILCRGGENGLA